jgi:ATP/maltotriose-dependent transcriptional regulator MalT/DNA-binding SARP family transcriptional activator
VSGYPIQPGKVQRPPLRDETLARHRLLDWLDVKIHNRVVFVIAEAGYGKTTLLADFSRRTRLRTLWYRMDEEDRNWVSFFSYLVAAGRVHDPEFAPRTSSMLEDTGPGGASRDDVTEAFLRELPSIATDGAALILDDFHVADDVPDIRQIAKLLIERAPERLTLVISGRRPPPLAVGRLRALGEWAELSTADLRFSESETADLFANSFGKPLDREVLLDLTRRTEGWAASLQLVNVALRDRSAADMRDFIRRLTGAQTELYDYLAEEVVGDLEAGHQTFLMRTSLLQTVTADAAAVVSGIDARQVRHFVAESERLGLMSRNGNGVPQEHRYHPLVRDFLESRIRRDEGELAVQHLHRSVAVWARSRDWRSCCFHLAAALDLDDLHDVLDESIESIVGRGEFVLASDYLQRFQPRSTRASFEIIRSRVEYQTGNLDGALSRADFALEIASDMDAAISNCASMHAVRGEIDVSWRLAKQLAETGRSPIFRAIGDALYGAYNCSLEGNVEEQLDRLLNLAARNRTDRHTHFLGISLHNIASTYRALGRAEEALESASEAADALEVSSSGAEQASALLLRAWSLAHLGRIAEARADLSRSSELVPQTIRPEWLAEAADIETAYGDIDASRRLLRECALVPKQDAVDDLFRTVSAEERLRSGDFETAKSLTESLSLGRVSDQAAHMSRQLAVIAHVALRASDPTAGEAIARAMAHAEHQRAHYWIAYCRILVAAHEGGAEFDQTIAAIGQADPAYISVLAELVADRLAILSDEVLDVVRSSSQLRPDRWLPPLRVVARDATAPGRWRAAAILDLVGTADDVPLLRAIAKSARHATGRSSLGRLLARRLAPRVVVEDLGRVEIRIGEVVVQGSELRRKVLAMLCFLLTRPRFSATRDEVIDALWPDLDPVVAVNSLNQTVYFLRRVFEPTYKEDLSPGYVRHGSDVLWLDPELITSRSKECRRIMDSIGERARPDDVDLLCAGYLDRFALDFAYEEWAVPFRTALHVSYLQIVERAVTDDISSGHHDRGIRVARRALEVDPTIESLERSLLRLYRSTGAHAAAAEQYTHYAAMVRDELGVEPPSLASL